VDDKEAMRVAIAKEYGFALYRRYSEPQAAAYLGVDLTTLKRWRRAGKTPAVNMGERQVRYLGIHIADMMLWGDRWSEAQNDSSK